MLKINDRTPISKFYPVLSFPVVYLSLKSHPVIPAKAGIQNTGIDSPEGASHISTMLGTSRLRGNDRFRFPVTCIHKITK